MITKEKLIKRNHPTKLKSLINNEKNNNKRFDKVLKIEIQNIC